jgi:hypothetical protein
VQGTSQTGEIVRVWVHESKNGKMIYDKEPNRSTSRWWDVEFAEIDFRSRILVQDCEA